MFSLTDECFNRDEETRIVEVGDRVSENFGASFLEITPEQFDKMKKGGVLYYNDGEYVTFVRFAKEIQEG